MDQKRQSHSDDDGTPFDPGVSHSVGTGSSIGIVRIVEDIEPGDLPETSFHGNLRLIRT